MIKLLECLENLWLVRNLSFFRYAIPQLKWVLLDKENEKFRYVQTQIDMDWQQIDHDLEETWRACF
jgi:hypothetical protein